MQKKKSAFYKIRFILLFVYSVISLSSFSQDLDKKISIKVKDKPLTDVMKIIEDAGQINFSYSAQLIPADKRITYKANKKAIRVILDDILLKNGITYKIVENQVVLRSAVKVEELTTVTKSEMEVLKPKHTVSGYIKDEESDEIMISAYIHAKGTNFATVTNSYGFFSLTLPDGIYELTTSYIGYTAKNVNVDLNSNKRLDINIKMAEIAIASVVVTANTEESEGREHLLGKMKLSPKTLTQMPGFVGDVDIIKSLQAIPGIKTYGDGSALFYVRGGNSDQNIILVDEAPIYNPSHLFGFFTALAPDAIKDVEAYKGDFPANYGGRLSSVIDVKIKDGNMKKFGFSGSIGTFTSHITLEGPLKKEKSSFFISYRHSNLNWLQLKAKNDRPLDISFSDLNAKFNICLNKNNRLFFTLYGGKDDFLNKLSSSFGISWSNVLGTIRWNHIYNNKLFSNTTFYISQYNYLLYLSKAQNNYWNSGIGNGTLKTDFSYFRNATNTFKMGLEMSVHTSNPGNLHFSDVTVQENVPSIAKYQSENLNLYFSHEKDVTPLLKFRYGFRVPIWRDLGAITVYQFDNLHQLTQVQDYSKNDVYYSHVAIEPRLSADYSLNEYSELKASYTRNTQFLQLITNSVSPFTSLEVWVPSGPNIKPQISNQFSLGYFRYIKKSKLNFSAEAFYKKYDNQIDYKDNANLLMNPEIEGELRFGTANAYGLELMLRKTEGKFTGWIGYTYSRIIKTIEGVNNGKSYAASYDRPHNACVNIAYNSSRHWQFSANWVYMTGSPVSKPVGFYEFNGQTVPLYGDKNNGRLPDYHRLDLSATYRINKPDRKYQHNIVFTLYNAYGRKNPFVLTYNKIMNDNGKFIVPTNIDGNYLLIPTAISVSGIIPSIAYNFKF